MRGRFFSIYSVIDLTDGLLPRLCQPDWIGRPWRLRDSTLGSHMYISYQLVQVPSPAPPLPGEGWKDLPRLLVSHFRLRRPVHCSDREWMTFCPAWGQ